MCQCVRTVKGKQLELSTPNLVVIGNSARQSLGMHPKFSRFDTIPAGDGHSHRHRQTTTAYTYRASIATRGKNASQIAATAVVKVYMKEDLNIVVGVGGGRGC